MEDIINNQAMQQAQTAIDQSFNSLVATRKQIPEQVFKYFLPFFTAQRSIAEVPEVLAKWISIAGAPNAQVDVIGKDKKVLFTVPGIMNTLSLETAVKRGGLDMSRIMEDYELHASHTPASGQRFLSQAIGAKLSAVSAQSAESDEQRWLVIFNHYGIALPVTKTAVQAQPTTEELDYE